MRESLGKTTLRGSRVDYSIGRNAWAGLPVGRT